MSTSGRPLCLSTGFLINAFTIAQQLYLACKYHADPSSTTSAAAANPLISVVRLCVASRRFVYRGMRLLLLLSFRSQTLLNFRVLLDRVTPTKFEIS